MRAPCARLLRHWSSTPGTPRTQRRGVKRGRAVSGVRALTWTVSSGCLPWVTFVGAPHGSPPPQRIPGGFSRVQSRVSSTQVWAPSSGHADPPAEAFAPSARPVPGNSKPECRVVSIPREPTESETGGSEQCKAEAREGDPSAGDAPQPRIQLPAPLSPQRPGPGRADRQTGPARRDPPRSPGVRSTARVSSSLPQGQLHWAEPN